MESTKATLEKIAPGIHAWMQPTTGWSRNNAGLVAGDEAARRTELGRFMKWTLPERLAAIVDKCYRDPNGQPDDAPVDALGVLAPMGKLRDYWRERARA